MAIRPTVLVPIAGQADRAGTLSQRHGRLWTVVLVAALLVLVVGIHPFQPRTADTLAPGRGEGDVARQAAIVALLLVVAGAAAVSPRAPRLLFPLPTPVTLCFAWVALSIGWAIDPTTSFRRVVFLLISTHVIFAAARALGPDRTLAALRVVLTAVLAVNFVSVFVISNAVHTADELNAALIGDWRGLYFHKNIAGSVTGMAVLIFLVRATETKQVRHILPVVCAVLFLIGTTSRAALAACVIASIGMALYQWSNGSQGKRIFLTMIASGMLIMLLIWSFMSGYVGTMLNDPTALAGRSAVWNITLEYVSSHLWLGSGFGSFWQIGENSPVNQLATIQWVLGASHSHNGYLQLLAEIGLPGLLIAMFAFALVPLKSLVRGSHHKPIYIVLFGGLLFICSLNILEDNILSADQPVWTIYVTLLAAWWSCKEEGDVSTEPKGRKL